MRRVVVLLVAVGWVVAAAATVHAGVAGRGGVHGHRVFRMPEPISDASSLVVSTQYPDLVYTAADAGHSPTIYVLNHRGALVGRTYLPVPAGDIEAMSVAGDGSLIVGDVGDNTSSRPYIVVYKIQQPGLGTAIVQPDDRVRLTYSDGPHNAESVLYDAGRGRLFVISKQPHSGKVYATGVHVFKTGSAMLRPIGAAPARTTDAAWLDGTRFAVVRNSWTATLYRYPSWTTVSKFRLPFQPHGESVTPSPDGKSLWLGSEAGKQTVLSLPLPSIPGLVAEPAVPSTGPRVSIRPARPWPPPPPATPTSRPASHTSNTAVHHHLPITPMSATIAAGALLLTAGALATALRRRGQER
jgi:hypothetical protein